MPLHVEQELSVEGRNNLNCATISTIMKITVGKIAVRNFQDKFSILQALLS